MKKIEEIAKSFKDPALFTKAFTHRSYLNENSSVRESNERLEFLGDAVLEFIVSYQIYEAFPKKEEGFLTALRAKIVNTENLAALARKLKLSEKILLSKGEREGGGQNNSSILANCVEALIGAIFLDQGIDATGDFIKEHLLSDLETKVSHPLKDFKSRFQEEVQARKIYNIAYKVIGESGPDHSKKFVVELSVEGKVLGVGVGKSKSEAEQKAAEEALGRIEELEIK